MDFVLILKIVALAESIGICILAGKKIQSQTITILFIVMILLFFLSVALFFPNGNINSWARQIPFFAGQIIMYLLAKEIIAEQSYKLEEPSIPTQLLGVGLFGANKQYFGFSDWFAYLTNQGFQYVLSLPLTILVILYIMIRIPYLPHVWAQRAFQFFITGLACLTMIQLGAFFVESQHLLPALLGAPIETIEFVWFYIALLLFGCAVWLFPASLEKGKQIV